MREWIKNRKERRSVRKRTYVSLCPGKKHHSSTYLSIIYWLQQWPLLLAIGLYQIPTYDHVGNLGLDPDLHQKTSSRPEESNMVTSSGPSGGLHEWCIVRLLFYCIFFFDGMWGRLRRADAPISTMACLRCRARCQRGVVVWKSSKLWEETGNWWGYDVCWLIVALCIAWYNA